MSELKRHKRSDAIKWTATAIAFVFVVIVLVGVCLQAFGKGKVKPSEWFKKDEQTEQTTPDDQSDAGLIVTPSEDKTGIKLNVRKAAANADGNDADTYTVTATVLPSYADDKSVDWSLAYAPYLFNSLVSGKPIGDPVPIKLDPENDNYAVYVDNPTQRAGVFDEHIDDLKFMRDVPVTDCVALNVVSGTTNTVTIVCKRNFRHTILLTATVRSNPKLKSTCNIDYLIRPQNISPDVGLSGCLSSYDFVSSDRIIYTFDRSKYQGSLERMSLKPTYFVGSLKDDLYPVTSLSASVTGKLNDEYIDELKKTDVFPTPFPTVLSGAQMFHLGGTFILSGFTQYNFTSDSTWDERMNAGCVALRSLGNKPFMTLTVTFTYSDEIVEIAGCDKTLLHEIPVYADLDSLEVVPTNMSVDSTSVLF